MAIRDSALTFAAAVGLVGCCTPAISEAALSAFVYPVDPIPMRLEIDVDADRYYVGEDFPITVRIVNPNGFDVYLRGFEFGPLEPHMEIAVPGHDEFQDASRGGSISAMGGPPVRVSASGYIEHRRLVYSGTKLDDPNRYLLPLGVYQLRMKRSVGAVAPEDPERYTKVDWTSQVVTFTLTMPMGRDLLALEFLRREARAYEEQRRQPAPGSSSVRFELDSCRRFIEQFPDTVYAPEMRWRVVKLLQDELGNNRTAEQDIPQMVELWEECLTFCIERGRAYAEESVWWDMDKGGNRAVNLARKYKRVDLLKGIVEKIDRKYPQDEDAALYRQVMVLSEAGSPDDARKASAALSERFPNSRYVRSAQSLIEWLERQEKPD